MKQYILPMAMAALVTSLGLFSCSRPEVKVVESDYTYTLDKNKIAVDIPKPYHFYVSPIVTIDGDNPLLLSFFSKPTEDKTGARVKGYTAIPVSLTLSRPASKALTLAFGPDETKDAKLKKEIPGVKDLPADLVKYPTTVEVPAGETSVTFEIALPEELPLKEEGLFLTTFAFSTKDKADYRTGKGHNTIAVFLINSSLDNREDGLTVTDRIPEGLAEIDPSTLDATIEGAKGDAESEWLFDGKIETDYAHRVYPKPVWLTPGAAIQVHVASKPKTVRGVTVYFHFTGWGRRPNPKSFDVLVTNNSGLIWAKQGAVQDISPDAASCSFLFEEPLDLTDIRLEDIQPQSEGASIGIVELKLFAPEE